LKIIITILLFSFQVSCITSSSEFVDDSGAHLVERSKESQPPWMNLEPSVLHRADDAFVFLQKNSFILQLSRGVTETQMLALKDSRLQFVEYLKTQILEKSGQKRFINKKSEEKFGEILEEVGGDAYLKYAKVADIYFEKYKHPSTPVDGSSQVYFKTFVLVQYPTADLAEAYEDIALKFRTSNNYDIEALSPVSKELASQNITP